MTAALEGGEGSASRRGRSLPPGKTRYLLYRRLGGTQCRSGQVRKISPSPGFDPRTVQHVASRYTDYASQSTSLEGPGEIVHVLAVLFNTVFYCVMCNGFYLTGVPQLIVELRNVLPGFACVLSRRVQNALHSSYPAQAGVFSSRAKVYKRDEAETVRICMYHVSPCNCIGSSSLRDCYIVSDSRMSARHGRWVSLLSFLLHIELRVVFLEWNLCSLQQRTLQDMKMLKEAGSSMGDKNVPTGTNTLFSIFIYIYIYIYI
jgi:hypothetical protein